MAVKKNITKKQKEILDSDETLIQLKQKYFKLAKLENYPKSKNITAQLDKLEEQINNRKNELL